MTVLQVSADQDCTVGDDSPISELVAEALQGLQQQSLIEPLDRFTGVMLCSHAVQQPLLIGALATMLSHNRGRGHTCLELASLANSALWTQICSALNLDTGACERLDSEVVGTADDDLPLLLDGGRLHFQKVLRAEQAIVAKIVKLTSKSSENTHNIQEIVLDGVQLDDQQQLAVKTALGQAICLISGGPGTGKTTVAAAILSCFSAGLPADDFPGIGLTAPTGKAAARLQDAVSQEYLASGAGQDGSIKAATVHRLLGWSPRRRTFRFNADNPLPLKLLIIDEVSMIDLELMRAILDAVPVGCRLVLLGDRQQLASVAPGNIMGDFCAGIERRAEPIDGPAEPAGLCRENIVLLRHNYRFDRDSGIQRLAQSVAEGDFSKVLAVLSTERDDLVWVQQHEGAGLDLDLGAQIPAGFVAALSDDDIQVALGSTSRFRILTGLRHGPFGSLNLNRLVENQLRSTQVIGTGPGFYRNQLVMASGNDYALRLFNGDTGIIRADPEGRLAAVFDHDQGQPRWLACDRLRSIETAFATTIHKSQGSEFDQVVVVLPEQGSPVLSRELLYTAVTRARTRVVLVASLSALEFAVEKRTHRFSGLADRLWV